MKDAAFEYSEQLANSENLAKMIKSIMESIDLSGLINQAETLATKFATVASNAYAAAQAAYNNNLYAASVGGGRGPGPGGPSADQINTYNYEAQLSQAAEAEKKLQAELAKSSKAKKGAKEATEKLTEAQKAGIAITEKYLTPLEKYNKGMTELADLLKQGEISTTTYERAMQDLNDTLAESNPLVNDLSNAFGDFVAGGLKDFKGFVDSIKNTFKKALSDMIATALRNRIMIPIQTAMMGGTG